MRKAEVFHNGVLAGHLHEKEDGGWVFEYLQNYKGNPVSLTMPVKQKVYEFQNFPSPFEGLLPEGIMLEALLRREKIDRSDFFQQLMVVGDDVVGALQFKELK